MTTSGHQGQLVSEDASAISPEAMSDYVLGLLIGTHVSREEHLSLPSPTGGRLGVFVSVSLFPFAK